MYIECICRFACFTRAARRLVSLFTQFVCVRVHLTYREMQSIFETMSRYWNWASVKLWKRSRARERMLAAKWLDFGEWRETVQYGMDAFRLSVLRINADGASWSIFMCITQFHCNRYCYSTIFYLHLWPKVMTFFPSLGFLLYFATLHRHFLFKTSTRTHLLLHAFHVELCGLHIIY